MKKLIAFSFLTFSLNSVFAQFNEYEWILDNTSTNTGERVVAVLDAGTINSFDGIELAGFVVDIMATGAIIYRR
jgi:hypothetical protein